MKTGHSVECVSFTNSHLSSCIRYILSYFLEAWIYFILNQIILYYKNNQIFFLNCSQMSQF